MNDETNDITPSIDILHSVRNDANMKLATALCEFVDNSLDAGATRIDVTIEPNSTIRILDNGRGCADLIRMARMGNYQPDGLRIGRYGMGFSVASVWAASCARIFSACGGRTYELSIDWDSLKTWRVGSPLVFNTPGTSPHMDIVLTNLRPQHCLFRGAANIVRALQRTYPFLAQNGKTLCLNGEQIPDAPLPKLTDVVEDEGAYEGRAFSFKAGICEDFSTGIWRSGITIMLRDRVITEHSLEGCGEYGAHRFFAVVQLLEGRELEDGSTSEPWLVDKTKTGLTEQIRLFLNDWLYSIIEPLLEKADEKASDMILRGLEEELSGDWIGDALLGRAKERRPNRGSTTGTVEPIDSGARREHAANLNENARGPILMRKGVGRKVKVRFAPLPPEKIAEVGHNSQHTDCTLNENHPFVRENRDKLLVIKLLVIQEVINHWLENEAVRTRIFGQKVLALEGRAEQVDAAMAIVLACEAGGNQSAEKEIA